MYEIQTTVKIVLEVSDKQHGQTIQFSKKYLFPLSQVDTSQIVIYDPGYILGISMVWIATCFCHVPQNLMNDSCRLIQEFQKVMV